MIEGQNPRLTEAQIEAIHAFADGQLGRDEAKEVQQLISLHPQALAEYEWALQVKSTLKTHCVPCADDQAWKNVQGRLAEIDSVRRTEFFVGRFAPAFCAMVLVILVSVGLATRTTGGGQLTAEQAATLFNMAPSFESNAINSDRTQEFLRSHLRSENAHMMPEGWAGVQVTSVAGGYIDGYPVVRYVLEDSQGPVLLFVIRDASGVRGFQAIQQDAFQRGEIERCPTLVWTDGDFTLFLMAHRTDDELVRMASQVQIVRQ